MDLTNNIALVTGAASGIGAGIANRLAHHGAQVIIADINIPNAQIISDHLTESGHLAQVAQLDVTNADSIEQCIGNIIHEHGKIDILVNNAGTVGAKDWELRTVPNEEDWDLVFSINVKGIAKMTQAVSESMKVNRQGKVINIASIAGRLGSDRNPPYNVSKASVISLTQSQAFQLAPYNINVNAICPGLLWTPIWERIGNRRAMSPNPTEKDSKALFLDYVSEKIPLGRPQEPRDIGNLAVFLASNYSENITGQSINVSGGYFMN